MTRVTLEQVQQRLAQLLDDVALGEHFVIVRDDVPVAEIAPLPDIRARPVFGSAKGMIRMSEDFDAPLEDFRDFME